MEPDYIAGTMMELNLNQFGFNKSVAQVYELNKALNIDGSYSTFRKKAIGILGKFDAYLETEYNDVISKAQNASSYIRQMKEKDTFPYWRYDTMGDERVRVSHEALDGKIFSINDAKARNLTPPLEFGCRCTRTALRKDEVDKKEVIGFEKASKILGKDLQKIKDNGFLNNPGETLEIFDLNKQYIDKLPKEEVLKINDINYTHFGLSTFNVLRGKNTYKSLKRDPKATKETILKEFDDKQIILYKDYTSREIALDKSIIEKQLAESHKVFGSLKDILKSPTEVYLRKFKNKLQYTYIKIYDKDVMIVVVSIDKKTGMKVQSWYKNTQPEKLVRKGILISHE
ncbi:phage minor head protein [Tenacibaculum maritimum]|nr:phage minor head protein [Tenacibaculum maritimum]MDB0612686.1 phage minor head protein [Tenacibaculum maritimum]